MKSKYLFKKIKQETFIDLYDMISIRLFDPYINQIEETLGSDNYVDLNENLRIEAGRRLYRNNYDNIYLELNRNLKSEQWEKDFVINTYR